ncbi:MAG: ferredoxin [Terriglobia bacterium]
MKIVIDRDACIGAASCVAIAPHVFELDDDNKAVLIDKDPDDKESVRRAAEACPTAAIEVTD